MELLVNFDVEEINRQVKRIIDSMPFKRSPALSKFLEFVVSETLQKRSSQIKEYTIAVNVLNRRTDFNPHDDSIVRIHAGRLRRAMDEYYLTEGKDDQIIVDIPKGCYIPQFQRCKSAMENDQLCDTSRSQIKPMIAVLPFKTAPHLAEIEEFATMLGEYFSAELSRFQDISVIGYFTEDLTSKAYQNVLEVGKSVGADYIITGNIQRAEQSTHIQISLLNGNTGALVMTWRFSKDFLLPAAYDVHDQIVCECASALGGYFGILFNQLFTTSPIKVSTNRHVYEAIRHYYKYQSFQSRENFDISRSFLILAIEKDPNHAVAWSLLGELYLTALRNGQQYVAYPLVEAQQCVLRAMEIDPNCQQAWHAMTLAQLYKKDKEACLQAANKCLELNPNHASIAMGVGNFIFAAGYFEEGYSIMVRAAKLNPRYPCWLNSGLVLYYLLKKNYQMAYVWAEKLNSDASPWSPMFKALTLSNLNRKSDAAEELSKTIKMAPDIVENLRSTISTFYLSEELIDMIVKGLDISSPFDHIVSPAAERKIQPL